MDRTARHYDSGKPVRVCCDDGRIDRVEALPESTDAVPEGRFIGPGWIDIQINGFAGVNFGDPELTADRVREVARRLWATGVTHFLPTLITDSVERLTGALARLADAAAEPDLNPTIPGFHLEGPYLSVVDGPRGAHPLEHCKDPNWDEFRRLQDAAEGRILLVTLAPERDGSCRFIERAVDSGVRIAIGHTAATREQILDAVAAGATMSTHLGNAAHDLLQRHRNYIYDQLGEDRLLASLIVDGHHLPAHLVKIFVRAKGIERTIMVSDAVQYAAMPPGVYDAGYRKFEVREDGFIGVVGEPRLAGSGLLLQRGLENVVRFAEVSLGSALRMMTETPARFLGIADRLGVMAPGREASLTIFDWDADRQRVAVVETIVAGRQVHPRTDR